MEGCGLLELSDAHRAIWCQEDSMTDAQVQVKAIIAAALIWSRAIDPEGLVSANKDISNHKLAHLRDLTARIYAAIAEEDGSHR
jgi:hypothetical protein